MNSKPLWDWVNERHAIYIRKEIRAGRDRESLYNGYQSTDEFRWSAKGYENKRTGVRDALTRDPILQQYRFCNVFRELDSVTGWIRYNIRRKYADHPDLWLMLAIARTINWPDTLQYVMDHGGWLDHPDWQPSWLTQNMEAYAKGRNKVYTGAYMIRAANKSEPWGQWSKHRYISEVVIGRLWEDREIWQSGLRVLSGDDFLTYGRQRLQQVWAWFQQPRYIGWGPFMAYQVVVDMRHTRYLRDAPDINSWAALGPGSRRGLNRLAGREVSFNLSQEQGLEEMLQIYREQDGYRAPWVPHIELSDIQNCLCETDKYLRVKQGEGRPRALYRG